MANIEKFEGGIITITLFGELDNHEANRIRTQVGAAIFAGDVRTIIWDLSHLQFMDSSGIGLILGRMRELGPYNGETFILNPSPTMEKIFTFSGLEKNIRFSSVQDMMRQLGGVVHEK
ncbi:MAG TPA: anti-sigma factor antagonist [Sporosarcina sp.]|mgnify:CR=1 FL=1|nr:anti-sigma factor antagonist [Sporosarcina sp.]